MDGWEGAREGGGKKEGGREGERERGRAEGGRANNSHPAHSYSTQIGPFTESPHITRDLPCLDSLRYLLNRVSSFFLSTAGLGGSTKYLMGSW